ncbi:hypothetical protein [Streptomyces hirsutus]|uniref:hypothetical protein n=1 Tax=Streptomyces hirsutus TaxID=35620 RepID=UPI0006E2429D|nr:hypothetical protein [Streptomyces hirsutus]
MTLARRLLTFFGTVPASGTPPSAGPPRIPPRRAELSEEAIEDIEESGVDPTPALIERLATALEAGARIDPRTSPGFRFEDHVA